MYEVVKRKMMEQVAGATVLSVKWVVTRQRNTQSCSPKLDLLGFGRRVGLERDSFGPALAHKDKQMSCGRSGELPVAVHRNPIPTQSRFSVFQVMEGDGENLKPIDS